MGEGRLRSGVSAPIIRQQCTAFTGVRKEEEVTDR